MIFCIAGTGDGRALALRLRKENWPVLVSVVSEYGERLVKAADLPVVQTALDQAGMEVFLQEQGVCQKNVPVAGSAGANGYQP